MRNILSVGSDAKTIKGVARGFLTGILYLAPAKISGYQVCPMASVNCTAHCIYRQGRGAFSNVQAARIAKTRLYFEKRAEFMAILRANISALVRKAYRSRNTTMPKERACLTRHRMNKLLV